MVWHNCEIMVTLDFIFRLVHCISEDDSFHIICLNVLEGIKQFYLLMWFKKMRLETLFKGDNVKLWKLGPLFLWESSERCRIYYAFWFSVTKQSFENGFGFPNDQKYPCYALVLKLNVTLARPLRLVILYFFKWKILSDDRRLYLHDSKWNSRSDVDGLAHTKQLLNLLCIVYKSHCTCKLSFFHCCLIRSEKLVCFHNNRLFCHPHPTEAFFKYWPVWFEHCGYMWHISLPNAS